MATAPDEATVALTPAVPDEATVALLAAAPVRDSAVMVAGPSDESTVPVRSGAPDDEGAAEPAVAESVPGATRTGFSLTRRQLLIGLSGVTGVAVVAGAVAAHSATKEPAAAPPPPSSPAVTRPRTPESAAVTPQLPVQRRPISTLAEYRAATGAAPFPADAIALTIDDGPHPLWTPKILRLLDKHHVPAVFCMIGNQVLGHEAVAQTVSRAGHQLANHTWSHPTKLAAKPGPFVQKQLVKAQAKIKNTTGYAPTLFRSPGGDWSPQLLREVAHAGLLALDWTVDPRDWARPGVNKIEQRMLSTKPGQIILCHDGGGDRSQTYNALSVVIPALKARGLQFVALDAPAEVQTPTPLQPSAA
ncbi:polysaccharide deacetylase family protein [Actinoplanes solisilvae]|uniref:polysaccharide deacetylase family protein n=1 Tax=Actinoplanes solisilvae TaxID=2486853 RepID=UPI000FD75D03|nr:polysaccharide deacetylase family protein [Actinoplanes solisilvae]